MRHSNPASYEKITGRIPAKELSTLLKVSSSLASTMDLVEVLRLAIASTSDLLSLDTGAIYTLDGHNLYLGATVPPLPPQFPEELRHARLEDHPHLAQAIQTKAPVYLRDARTATISPSEKVIVDSRHLISILYFPLVLRDQSTGAFIVGTTDSVREFTENEIDLCHVLAYQVSLAIANAQLYAKTQQALLDLTRAYDATLEGWSHVLDMRDHVTDEHTRRVADLTIALARRMGITEAELDHIRRGALLHDIGKMGIPDSILQKASALNAEELAIMQTHPEKAYSILSQIDYLAPCLDIPYCHHEKWDGSGYPRGLRGEQIPFTARIFAVVDVYDALTSNRPYRKAWSRKDALAYLREQSGRHFFPGAVQTFIEMAEQESL